MATKSVKSGSELSQVVIMTLFITSGFLAVSCLVFSMLIPSRQAAAEDQRTDLMNLVKMFRDDKPDGLKSKRDRLKQFERQGDRDKNLRQVVEDNSKGLPGLVWSSFPATNSKSIPKAQTTRHQQSIDFKDAGMQDSLYLIARVRKTRPGVRASKMSFRPARGDSGKWGIKLVFELYENDEVKEWLSKRAKKSTSTAGSAPPRKSPGALPLKERRRQASQAAAAKNKAKAAEANKNNKNTNRKPVVRNPSPTRTPQRKPAVKPKPNPTTNKTRPKINAKK